MSLTEIDLSKNAKDATLTPAKISINPADNFTFPNNVISTGSLQVPLIIDPSTFTALDVTNRYLKDTSNLIAVDWLNRLLYANDGTTSNLDFSAPNLVQLYGILNVNGYTIQNVGTPVNPTDATTKTYVDTVAQGLLTKAACTAATTAALPAVTPAGSGVGKTLTENANGLLVVDGINVWVDVVNDGGSTNPSASNPASRVLIKNQVNPVDNGIYCVTDKGSAGTPFVLTRAVDFDGSPANEVQPGDFTFIGEGTVNASSGWTVTGNNNPVIVDTDPITFSQFSGAGQIIAGNGLIKTGNQLDVNPSDTSLSVSVGNISVNRDPAGALGLSGSGIAVNVGNGLTISGNAVALSAPVSVANGGTGQTSYTNGQILIGNTTGNTLVKTTLTGTTNQVNIANGAGSITLSTPQNIDSGANVTFNSAVLTGAVGAAGLTTGRINPSGDSTFAIRFSNSIATVDVMFLDTSTPALNMNLHKIIQLADPTAAQHAATKNYVDGGAHTVAGSNSQVQFNNAGAFGANANFVWDNTNTRLGLGNAAPAQTLDVTGSAQVSSIVYVDNIRSFSDQSRRRIDVNGRQLRALDSGGGDNVPSIDWGGRTMYDNGFWLSVDWQARRLWTTNGASPQLNMDWSVSHVVTMSADVRPDGDNSRNLGSASLNWADVNAKRLISSTSLTLQPGVDSATAIQMKNAAGTTTVLSIDSSGNNVTLPQASNIVMTSTSGSGGSINMTGTTTGGSINMTSGGGTSNSGVISQTTADNTANSTTTGSNGGITMTTGNNSNFYSSGNSGLNNGITITTGSVTGIGFPASGNSGNSGANVLTPNGVIGTIPVAINISTGNARSLSGDSHIAGTSGSILISSGGVTTSNDNNLSSGTGGSLILTTGRMNVSGFFGGNNVFTGQGGSIWLASGDALSTANNNTSGPGGNITLTSGAASGASSTNNSGAGGSLTLKSGNAVNSVGTGGSISLTTGNSTGSATLTGGGITLSTGTSAGGLTSGNILITTAGAGGTTASNGGGITLTTGIDNGNNTPLNGGSIILTSGTKTGGGVTTGGSITLTSGDTQVGGQTVQGGSITLTTGSKLIAGQANCNGGSITLTTGNPLSGNTDTGGNITLTSFHAANGGNLIVTGTAAGRGQVTIGGSTPDASASVDIQSTVSPFRGFLPPRMTTTNKNAIASPATGLIVYDTTLNLLQLYNGTSWTSVGAAINFVTREVPTGAINGSNVTFTLANTPVVGSEEAYLNGLLQNAGVGNDYTISGATITFTNAPLTGSVLLVSYRY